MSRYIVCIDAGHGGRDPGAVYNNYKEKVFALTISELTIGLLEMDGLSVITTRINDYYLKRQQRAEIANRSLADLFVSLHINSFPNPTANGIETYYRLGHKSSRIAANLTQSKLIQDLPLRNRGVKSGTFYVLTETNKDMTAILCELGFITNSHDRYLITSREFQVQAAKCIANGVLSFMREVKIEI